MKQSKLKLILMMMLLFGTVSGCSWFAKKVYVAPGQIVEIAEPITFTGWVKNRETGKRERRKVKAQSGWYAGRPNLPSAE